MLNAQIWTMPSFQILDQKEECSVCNHIAYKKAIARGISIVW